MLPKAAPPYLTGRWIGATQPPPPAFFFPYTRPRWSQFPYLLYCFPLFVILDRFPLFVILLSLICYTVFKIVSLICYTAHENRFPYLLYCKLARTLRKHRSRRFENIRSAPRTPPQYFCEAAHYSPMLKRHQEIKREHERAAVSTLRNRLITVRLNN